MNGRWTIAYFSMEVGLEAGIPTYAGGLGVLAGDTIRSAADLNVPMVAVTLLHRKGYFYQRLDPSGWQTEEPAAWVVEDFLEEMPQRAAVQVEGGPSRSAAGVRGRGVGGGEVPVYLLDTDLAENAEGSDAHPLPLRRRPALPALPGGGPGHRRRADAPGAGLHGRRSGST